MSTAVATQGAMAPKTIKSLMENPELKRKFNEMLGERTQGFFVSVSNAVSNNDLLKKADPNSIMMAAAVAASLDLPIDPNLGFAYIVPYGDKAQFQLGYRGFIQLSLRSGQFQTINVSEVRDGELAEEDFLTGEIKFKWLPRLERIKKPIIGYISYFRLINGFEKSFYMSKEEAEAHGKKFSQTYKKGFGKWKDDFDSMAKKTVIKLLLNKYAPLSIQMQKAVIADQGVVKSMDGDAIDVDYVDNTNSVNIDEVDREKQIQRISDHIKSATSLDELEMVQEHVYDAGLTELYNEKEHELTAKK